MTSTDLSQQPEDEHHHHGGPPLVTMADCASLLYPVLPNSLIVALARASGKAKAASDKDKFRCVRDNLLTVPGVDEERATELATRYFEDREIRSLLLVLSPQMSLKQAQKLYTINGLEHLDAAIARGKGVFLLLSHIHSLGAFLAISMLRQMDYDVRVALPSMNDPWSASRLRRAMYKVLGEKPSIPELIGGFYCQFNIRPIVQRLRENVVVAQTGDGWHSASFVDCDFLGRQLPFTTGVASVARTTGASIVPLFVSGAAPHLEFNLEAPYTVEREGDDLTVKVRHYAALLEKQLQNNLHAWEHWTVENTFDAMIAHRDKSLREKYVVGHD